VSSSNQSSNPMKWHCTQNKDTHIESCIKRDLLRSNQINKGDRCTSKENRAFLHTYLWLPQRRIHQWVPKRRLHPWGVYVLRVRIHISHICYTPRWYSRAKWGARQWIAHVPCVLSLSRVCLVCVSIYIFECGRF